MCLGVPARVLRVDGARATVESRGWTREADARYVRPRPGDFVAVEHGIVVAVLDPDEARETLRAWTETLGAATDA